MSKYDTVLFDLDGTLLNSDIDVRTAKNAELISVGVTWGFRSRSVLEAEGADHIISTPAQLLDILDL